MAAKRLILEHGLKSASRILLNRGGRNRIGRREKWPKKSWEEGEQGGKRREEGEIGSERREKGDLVPCSSPPKQNETKQNKTILKTL